MRHNQSPQWFATRRNANATPTQRNATEGNWEATVEQLWSNSGSTVVQLVPTVLGGA
jgi:hypothetical protein